jgi:hypothetical protein
LICGIIGSPTPEAGVPALAILGWLAAANSGNGAHRSRANKLDRMASELREKTAALIDETARRRSIELALEQHTLREHMFSTVVESASYSVITTMLDGTITTWNAAAE